MKVFNEVSVEVADEKLEKAATEKFVANETDAMCICRVSDG